MSEVYTELWNRLGDELEHSPVKEEQILIDGWAALISNKIVADIGAGNGRLGHHWYRLGATAIVFVDPSFAIFRCAQKFGSNGTPSLFLQADITALPLKDKSMEFVWCGGTLGLIENQKQGQLELQRISSETLLLSVLTEKRWVPRLYLWGNVIKPLVNRVKHFDLLFACCGVLSKFIWRTLRALRTLPYVNQRWLVGQIGELLESPMGWKRLQLALYDPILIPKIWKHKDDYYQSIAQTAGFNLASHRTLLLCDYFEFVRTK